MAKGKWISFLNVDDFYEKGALNSVLNQIKTIENEEKIMVGNLKIWNPDGSLRNIDVPSKMTLPLLIADLCEWPFTHLPIFIPNPFTKKLAVFQKKSTLQWIMISF